MQASSYLYISLLALCVHTAASADILLQPRPQGLPEYPAEARAQGSSARVTARWTVDADSKAIAVTIVENTGADAFADAVREYLDNNALRYPPTIKNGLTIKPPYQQSFVFGGPDAQDPDTITTLPSSNMVYPQAALKKGLQGAVTLRWEVQADGKPINIKVKRSSQYVLLDQAAIKHLRSQRFQVPASRPDNKPGAYEQTFSYKISQQ